MGHELALSKMDKSHISHRESHQGKEKKARHKKTRAIPVNSSLSCLFLLLLLLLSPLLTVLSKMHPNTMGFPWNRSRIQPPPALIIRYQHQPLVRSAVCPQFLPSLVWVWSRYEKPNSRIMEMVRYRGCLDPFSPLTAPRIAAFYLGSSLQSSSHAPFPRLSPDFFPLRFDSGF